MGAWAADTFGNDTACDWAYDLKDVDDLRLVRKAFKAVFVDGNNHLDADIACEALAACEVIARLKGNWGLRNPYSESVDQWVETHPQVPSEEVVHSAIAVIDRILTRPSELLELWEEGDSGEWHDEVNKLRERLRG